MGKIDYQAHLDWDAELREKASKEAQERFQGTIAARRPDILRPPESDSGAGRGAWYYDLRRRRRDTEREAKEAGYFYAWRVTSGLYHQAVLRALGLDLTDGELLAHLAYAFSRPEFMANAVVLEGRTYYWMSLKATARALPVLGIASKEWMYRRFQKLVKAGVLFSHTIDISRGDLRPRPGEFKSPGRYTLYAPDEKVMEVLKEAVE